MPNQEEIDQQRQLLEIQRRTLDHYLRQRAMLSAAFIPPGVMQGIHEARDAIRRIKGVLRGWGEAVEDHPDDEPPEPATGTPPAGAAAPASIGRDVVGRDQIGAQQSQGFVNNPSGTIYQTFNQVAPPTQVQTPTCPQPNTTRLIGREDILDQLIARLTTGAETIAISAVRGLPGVGKTDLLRATGCDPRTVAHFAGGVLYAELGPSPDLSQLLRRWTLELGREPPRSDDAETLAAVVRAELHSRRALLILDDVWESSLRAAVALRDCASATCRVLASSRSPQVAQELAKGGQPLVLDVLAPDPALELLRLHAPAVVGADEAGAATLAAALGRLPLALKLAGRLLANDRRSRQPCAALLATWQGRLDQLRGYERRPGVSDEQLSLDAIVGMSYAALPDDAARNAAAALAAFGATPLDWDWEAMAAVWSSVNSTQKQPGKLKRWIARITGQDEQHPINPDIAQQWENCIMASGLLDYDDATRRYSLHQTVHAFLARHADPATYERHATYYAALMERCRDEIKHESTIDAALTTLDHEIGQMERGQERAANASPTSFWDALLIGYALRCADYFELRGRYEQKIAWSEAGRQATQRQGQERDTAALLNNIGIVYEAQGRYDEAIAHHQQSLTIAQRIGDIAGTARQLGNLGIVYRLQGRYDEALAHYQQSLDIKQRIGDIAGTANTLGNLGIVYRLQERYDEALAHYQQSLAITQRIGDTAGTARQLGNLGIVYQLQGRYDEALAHYQQSLDISQHIGDLATTARQLGNLGVVYEAQERYDDAIARYQQSLAISERIGAVATSANNLWNLGTLYEKQGNLAAALPLIERAAQIAERIGMPTAQEMKAKVEELRAKIGGGGTAEPLKGE